MKKITLLFWTCIILIGCNSTPKVDLVAEAESIRNIEDQWVAANKAKDINKVISIFASDAVLMDPNKPITVGIDAIKKSWELWFSDTTYLHNTIVYTIDNIEVSASGDLGYARGTTHYSIKTQNGIIENDDKFVDIYKKINGEWKCIVGIFNTDKPMTGQ
jgi:ketosteroid isomerase-like protein